MNSVQFIMKASDFFADHEIKNEENVMVYIDFIGKKAKYVLYGNDANPMMYPFEKLDFDEAIEKYKFALGIINISPVLLGANEVGEKLGWSCGKVSVYDRRGTLPNPAVRIGTRSYWTNEQIEMYKKKVANKKAQVV